MTLLKSKQPPFNPIVEHIIPEENESPSVRGSPTKVQSKLFHIPYFIRESGFCNKNNYE